MQTSTTQTSPESTSQTFKTFTKISKERTLTCFGLIILTLASSAFWSFVHYSFAFLQLPTLVGAIILFRSPRLLKSLLPEQYIGLAGLVISIIKSLFMTFYIIYSLSEFFGAETIEMDHGVNKLSLKSEDFEIFPKLISDELRDISKLFGILLIVLFSIIMFFEATVAYTICSIFSSTFKLIKIIKQTDFTVSTISTTQRAASYVTDDIELRPSGLRRQDSAYNQLISGSMDELGDVEQGRQNV